MQATLDIIVDWLRDSAGEQAASIMEDTDLIGEGMLDSLQILNLVSFLEERFAVALPLDDFVPERFRSARSIEAMIDRLRGAPGAALGLEP